MHDIDRTTLEYGQQQMSGYEAEQFDGEWDGGAGGQRGMFSEAEEMELASDLLSVSNEAELEQFLGDFLGKAASVAGQIIKSPIGQAVGGVLKGVAKKALPLAGGAVGGYFGGPLGAQIGSGLASAAGSALGLEAEAMGGEDREFEGARQFVRMAADTIERAAAARGGDPRAVAQAAATAAARQFAPGLLGKGAPGNGAAPRHGGNQMQEPAPQFGGHFGAESGGGLSGAAMGGQGGMEGHHGYHGHHHHHHHGRWMRHGHKIVLYGV